MSLSRRLFAPVVLLLLLLSTTACFAKPTGTVRYTVSVSDLPARKFAVTVRAEREGSEPLSFAIPVWAPGYYQILSFEKNIANVQATDDKGTALTVTHPDGHTWTATGGGGAITLRYEVTAKEAGFGFFGSHLDDKTGFINGASAFMYVVDGKTLPTVAAYRLPENWKIACSLEEADAKALGTNSGKYLPAYQAPDYDTLIDCPVQMGQFDRLDFTVRDTPFSVLLVGQTDVRREDLVKMLTKISAAGIDLFGYPPFKRYYYIFHFAIGSFGGGLEHVNSTTLNIFGRTGGSPDGWASLAAHEYFHNWNVKRLHPAVLGPFDYTQKVRTGALWFCEGVTDYYGELLPYRAGLTQESELLAELANRITELQNTDARLRVSVEEASRKAWEGGSQGFGGLSYYLKGSLLGLLFDVKIRAATDDAKSLDDVLRLLDSEYGKKGIGYDEEAILRAINTVSGQDMTEVYRKYVRGTDEIPWNDMLKDAGLVYEIGNEKIPFVGVSTQPDKNGSLLVTRIVENSAAEQAGLKVGDEIVRLGETRVKPDEWQSTVRTLRVGQSIVLGIRREKMPQEIALTVGSRENAYRRLVPLKNADAKAVRVREGLLRRNERKAADAQSGSLPQSP